MKNRQIKSTNIIFEQSSNLIPTYVFSYVRLQKQNRCLFAHLFTFASVKPLYACNHHLRPMIFQPNIVLASIHSFHKTFSPRYQCAYLLAQMLG